MTNNKVNEMCDKVISVINECSQANFISDEKCNDLVTEIQLLKSKQERSLASKICEHHEKYLKQYEVKIGPTPEFSQEFHRLQTDCIFHLNEIESALYIQEKFKS